MKLFLGLLESAAPRQTRIFGEFNGKLVDLSLAYAAFLARSQRNIASAYELVALYFPESIARFLQLGDRGRRALAELKPFVEKTGVENLRGPGGERATYALQVISTETGGR